MSEISSRPEVKKVSLLSTVESGVSGSYLAHIVLSTLSKEAQNFYNAFSAKSSLKDTNSLRPVSAILRGQSLLYPDLARGVRNLPEAETLKLSALLDIQATGYRVNNTTPVKQYMEMLKVAQTPLVIKQTHQKLKQTLIRGHQKLFTSTLASACARASARVGFTKINQTTGPVGITRIVAEDKTGRALVTEISDKADCNVAMTSEIVGAYDGSCSKIMDCFETALEMEGVRASVPQRKGTGGICELAAAREFIRTRVRKVVDTGSNPVSDNTNRRTCRLNPTRVLQHKRR